MAHIKSLGGGSGGGGMVMQKRTFARTPAVDKVCAAG
jgi:hypothetical protein